MKQLWEQCKSLFRDMRHFFCFIPVAIKQIWKIDRFYIIFNFFSFFLRTLSAYPAIFLASETINAITAGKDFREYVKVAAFWITLMLLCDLLNSIVLSFLSTGRFAHINHELKLQFYQKCMELDYELLSRRDIVDLQKSAECAIDVFSYSPNMISNCLAMLINFISAISILIFLCPAAILLVLGMTLGKFLISTSMVRKKQNVEQEVIREEKVAQYMQDTASDFQNMKDIRVFDIGEKLIDRYWTSMGKLLGLRKRNRKYQNIESSASFLVDHFLLIAIYIILYFIVVGGNLSLGSFTLVINTVSLLKSSFEEFYGELNNAVFHSRYIIDYEKFINLSLSHNETKEQDVPISSGRGHELCFENVSFHYPGQEENVLEHLNFVIRSGERISVVGKNGAGKTTLIKLILRLYEPTEGRILLNGIPISQISREDYWKEFSAVFQDFRLFAFTIAENISALTLKKADQNIITAAEEADVAEKINELPENYETVLFKLFNENGTELSGGEQQKLAIARSYYKREAAVILWDEPVAALDPRAEYNLYRQMNHLVGDRTSIYISHRLASAKLSDKILVLDSGKVTAFGKHEDLIDKEEAYTEMFRAQAEYYE